MVNDRTQLNQQMAPVEEQLGLTAGPDELKALSGETRSTRRTSRP
jgi:hypothetical protein